MSKSLRYISIVVMISLVSGILMASYLQQADAAKAEGSPGAVSPKSYGSKNKVIVCGDKLCSEKNSDEKETIMGINILTHD